MFDGEGVEIGTLVPTGQVPTLQAGTNEITFSSASGVKFSNRAEVIVIRFGEEGKAK